MSTHLKHSLAGHLMHNAAGHLVIGCTATPCAGCFDLPTSLVVSWVAGDWGWTSPVTTCSPSVTAITVTGDHTCFWTSGGECVGGRLMGGNDLLWQDDLHGLFPSLPSPTPGFRISFGGPEATVYYYRATTDSCDVYGTYVLGLITGGSTATTPPATVTVSP